MKRPSFLLSWFLPVVRFSLPTNLTLLFALTSIAATFISVAPAAAEVDWSTVPYTSFAQMQSVNSDGSAAWEIPTVGTNESQAYRVVGVVVNNPEDMLDGTAAYAPEGPMWNLGGQWQIGIQAVDTANTPSELVGDQGGALVWMGQNYGNHVWHFPDPSYCYTDAEWLSETARLNNPIDAATGEPVTEPLRKGDLIEVRARGGLSFKGKFNVNEQHDPDPAYDFEIIILARDVPVEPLSLTLAEVKDATDSDIFDPSRQTGGEYYQARYVRLQDVEIADASGWGTSGQITVTDGDGRTLPIHLGSSSCWNTTSPPTGSFDLLGLFDQESFSGRDGYQMWSFGLDEFRLDADLNADGFVGAADLDIVRASWGEADASADISGNGIVDGEDLDLIRANWGFGSAPQSAAVPEPAMISILLGIFVCVAPRRLRR